MITLTTEPILHLGLAEFTQLCAANPDLRLERTAQGDLIVMSPAISESGFRNAGLTAQVWAWNQRWQQGMVFDSSAGFTLPSGAVRSPDVAWIQQARWDALTPEEKKGFAPICPDFVLELASPSDSLPGLQAKMTEYIANGIKLGWLIDPQAQQAWIYRPNQPIECLNQPITLVGESVLPGFVLDLSLIWSN